MIHTGEKPIQCEICGFTCRQKASLNWHMKKHDAEASYQFSCSICSKKFEKKDSVVAHKAKSHPEVLIAEALAANGGAVISSPTQTPETVPVLTQPDQPTVSQESQEAVSGALTPLQQVVLPLTPQTQIGTSQAQFLQLSTPHVVQVAHQQQPPTLLHLTTAAPALLSNPSPHGQLIQLSALTPTVPSMSTADPQSTLLTLSSVTTLAPAASLAPQQAVQWGRGAPEETQLPGEGELWDRVVVGGVHQDLKVESLILTLDKDYLHLSHGHQPNVVEFSTLARARFTVSGPFPLSCAQARIDYYRLTGIVFGVCSCACTASRP
ncbi:E3 ubiquitin-protein ligase ZFP91 [Larimichthys crocea]|uniref:Uncharacterized protein n=1 Tax=Larimichthys crocea TaxID=215358 RepID=A0ACD3Q5V5_LARCR|nr:E3 ubiquitin-protein ligase ZFP91 [Larimichthys crocea]